MRLPSPRGPLSAQVFRYLRAVTPDPDLGDLAHDLTDVSVTSGDVQITLWSLYQLHLRSFTDVREDAEWDGALLSLRSRIEAALETFLTRATSDLLASPVSGSIEDQVWQLIARAPDSGLVNHLHRHATHAQFHDFLRQRSIYHLQESDTSNFLLARLDGAPKVALAELQYDEFGAGRPEMLHQRLFAEAMRAVGLDDTYGHYIDDVDPMVLATNNVGTYLALHRRWRGRAVGHLAAFEATSSGPCRRICQGIRRLGLPEEVHRYFDEHVEADAVHEQMVLGDICVPLVAEHPELEADVLFGAASCLVLDELAGGALGQRWNSAPGSTAPGSTAPENAVDAWEAL